MSNDTLVLGIVIISMIVWGILAFRRWLNGKPFIKAPETTNERELQGEAADLLRENGYEVTHGKWKINIMVHVDEEELGSSLFVDYFARRDGKVYVVKVARSRKPLDLAAGSAVREQLLPFALLYDDTAGVLYVDVSARKVHQIRFELEL